MNERMVSKSDARVRAGWHARSRQGRRRRGRVAGAIIAGLILSATLPASAQVLEFRGALFDGAGLGDPFAAEVSPDGAHVYVASDRDDALGVFSRDAATGELELIEVQRNFVAGVRRLDNPTYIQISPDGAHVYVVCYDTLAGDETIESLVVFSRDAATGELSFVESMVDGGSDGSGNTIDGIDDSERMVLSPDGDHAYVLGFDTIALFNRNPTTGALTFVESVGDSSLSLLTGLSGVRVSPDGAHIYVVSSLSHGLALFSRNPADGRLTFEEELQNNTGDGNGNTITGLARPYSVDISPDGSHVYVGAFEEDSVAVFSRDATTGDLSFVEALFDGGSDAAGNPIDGIRVPAAVRVSPDSAHVYVTGTGDNAVAVFSRNSTTGVLTFLEMRNNSEPGIDGLVGPTLLAISPTGDHLYVPGPFENNEAVVVFSRETASASADFGRLSFVEVQRDDEAPVFGLNGPESIRLTPDGRHAYIAGLNNDALAVFARDDSTGDLEFVEALLDGGTDAAGNTIETLDAAGSVTPSPDGAHVYLRAAGDNAVTTFMRDPVTGILTLVEALVDGGTDSAGTTITGLQLPTAVAIGPDGAHVYATGGLDNSIVLFERDADTGRLSFVEALIDGETDGAGNTIDGIQAPGDIAVSPDGTKVIVGTLQEQSLAVFSRDPTSGRLSFVEALFNGGTDGAGNTIEGLVTPQEITFSPDSAHVLVTNVDVPAGVPTSTVVVFSQDSDSGALTFLESLQDGDTDVAGNTIDGLAVVRSVAVSPDGGHVAIAGFGGGSGDDSFYGNDALALFNRNTDATSPDFGRLSLVEFLPARGGMDGFGNDLFGLEGLSSVTFGPTAADLYMTATGTDSVAMFNNTQVVQWAIGGTVSGLAGTGLVLQNNGGDDLDIDSDGDFTFATDLDDGSDYSVSVATQPTGPSQTCTVANGSGTLNGADVADIQVDCATDQFTVGGTVTGLSGTGLVLQNNGDDDLDIDSDGDFTFATDLDDGSDYSVSVATQPTGPSQTCTVSDGSGTLNGVDVTDIQVDCATLEVSVTPAPVDFGAVELGASGTATVTVTNTGTPDLTITDITAPAAPFAIGGGDCLPPPVTLAGGENCTITVTFAPTAKSGPQSASFDLVSNASSSPDTVNLTGQAQALIIPALDWRGLLLLCAVMLLAGYSGIRRTNPG